MNIRTVVNINAVLLTILGVTMLIPASIAYVYGEIVYTFLICSTICITIGLLGWFFTRKYWIKFFFI